MIRGDGITRVKVWDEGPSRPALPLQWAEPVEVDQSLYERLGGPTPETWTKRTWAQMRAAIVRAAQISIEAEEELAIELTGLEEGGQGKEVWLVKADGSHRRAEAEP